jgi:ethanolamine utilization microcompartment shell protein EutL
MDPQQMLEPEWIFPFQGMAVGDSFFIPTARVAEMMYAIESGAKRAQVRIKAYPTVKDECLGVRAWRVR